MEEGVQRFLKKNFHIQIFFSGRGPDKFGTFFFRYKKKKFRGFKHIKPWIPRVS